MFKISKINKILGGILYGDKKINIEGPCSIIIGKENHISFIKSSKYIKYFNNTKASAIVVNKKFTIPDNLKKTIIKVDNPSISFLKILNLFKQKKTSKINIGIHISAFIDKTVKLGKNIYIGENVIIEQGTCIENNVQVFGNATIGSNCCISNGSIIKSNVSIKHDTFIGTKCIVKSGAIIGDTGFGLITDNKIHHQIPHFGKVIINDNVLIGNNCTIDRGTLNNTIIDSGTKFDNQVHIGHNVNIGKNCIICAQVGIGGSTIISDNVIIGGQTGIIDHLKIHQNVIIGPKSYVVKSIKANSYFSGNPARNHKDHIKQDIIVQKLPTIYKKLIK